MGDSLIWVLTTRPGFGITNQRDKVRKAAKHMVGWTDEQLQNYWDNPPRRKDGVVTLKGAHFCDAVLFEQYRRRNLGSIVTPKAQ